MSKKWIQISLLIFATMLLPITSFAKENLNNVSSWEMHLNDIDIDQLLQSTNELVIIDPDKIISEQLQQLKATGKTIIANISIGRAPTSLSIKKKKFKKIKLVRSQNSTGYYETKYWKKQWFNKYLKPKIKKLKSAGYDGICLDQIDSYKYWGMSNKTSKYAVKTARLVRKINKKFKKLTICQLNSEDIFDDLPAKWKHHYANCIDGLATENTFFNNTDDSLPTLKQNKTYIPKVFNVEYIGEHLKNEYLESLETSELNVIGYSPYFSVYNPESGGTNPGSGGATDPGSNPNSAYQGLLLPEDFQAFNSDSIWNQSIPDNPAIDSNSNLMISTLVNHCGPIKANTKKWTVPVHVINYENSPKFQIPTSGDCLFYTVDPDDDGIAEGSDGQGIPVPEEAWPDPEGDGHMCLIDPVMGKAWDFSRFKKLGDGSYTASIMDEWDLNGSGQRTPFWGENGNWWRNGARGSGFPLIAGLILLHEIESGISNPTDSESGIKHPLVFACQANRKTTDAGGNLQLNLPASRTDGWGTGPEYIPEGAVLQLDPNYDISHLNAETQVVARALQKYGMINGDNAGSFVLYFQNLGEDGGSWQNYNFELHKIPISQFKVLKTDIITK